MGKLKPCPFCGNSDLEIEYGSMLGDEWSESGDVYGIHCSQCGEYMSNDRNIDLVKSWNKGAQMKTKLYQKHIRWSFASYHGHKECARAVHIKKFMEQMEAIDFLRLGNIWWFIDQTGI